MSFESNTPYRNILIYGVGLMGSSLSLSIKKYFPDSQLSGIVRSESSKQTCKKLGTMEKVYTEEEFLRREWEDYELIIFGTPVHLIKKQIANIPKSSRATITDMGSTKRTIVDSVENYYRRINTFQDIKEYTPNNKEGFAKHNYISSHPMCGSEQAGPENSIPELYKNKLCLLTPLPNSEISRMNSLVAFWEGIGMKTHMIDPDTHDRVLSYLSHSPHIISSLMVQWAEQAVGEENSRSPMAIMGGGFRDMARIAGSNPEMWQAILSENRNFIKESLEDFRFHLDKMIGSLEKGNPSDWNEFFKKAHHSKINLTKT